MARMHDADLCKRIRELEDRVRELEARPNHYYCGCNHWHYTTPYYPTWITDGTSTEKGITIGTTAYDSSGIQYTYTSSLS